MTGSVVFFNEEARFGYIAPDRQNHDVFVHASGLRDKAHPPQAGDRVEFEVIDGPKGPKAIDMIVIETAPIAERVSQVHAPGVSRAKPKRTINQKRELT
jgi:cold shock CspA family protein